MFYKKVPCYKFDELSPENQNRVINTYRDYDLDMLTIEDVIWEFTGVGETVADAGFLDPDFQYDVSYCQGRGVCFDCSGFNFDLLLDDLDIPHKDLMIKLIEEECNPRIERPDASYAYHYVHEKCRRFYLNSERDFGQRIQDMLNKIEEHIENKRLNLCLKACELITEFVEETTSDEHVAETLRSHEWYFDIESLKVVDEFYLCEEENKGGENDTEPNV